MSLALRRHLEGGAKQIAAGRYAIARESEAKERQGGSGRFGSSKILNEPEVDFGRSVQKAQP